MNLPDSVSRRGLMFALGAGGVVLGSSRQALADPVFAEYPFQLGIAAGDPAPDGFVIWTRLAPRPLEIGHGMPSQPVPVKWEVASDRGFATVVQKGEAVARPELAHAVHVEITGLEPGRDYFYRFIAGTERTPSGRAKTAPAAGSAVAQARFGVLGCQAYEQGLYTGHRKIAGEDLDFVYCYGDYIYEGRGNRTYTGSGGTIENPRQHIGGECYSLDDYRRRYAQYKLDTDLQASHLAAAWYVTWDDHEIQNNWVSDQDPDEVPPEIFNLRRQAAAQAFYEHMPLRRSSFPRGAEMQLYRQASWGDLLDLNFLDTRQFRTNQPCNDGWATTCAGVSDPASQVLGEAQEQWLYRNLDRSRAHWKVLAQQIMVMDLDRKEGPETGYNLDTWAGYSIPRQRLLDRLRERRIGNTIVLTGDEHQNYAGELFRDSRNPDGAPIATEFVTTSMSSSGDGQDQRADGRRYLADNPFLKFNNAQRGYVVCDVTPERWQTEFKVLDKVSERGGTLTTRAKLAVASGDARIVAA
ncbi:alkaline phosphatase D family protein [Brevundimonas lenta]|uniref:Alkaline phosphatase D n=1 Tax=Brevundimonas lenta TaxID=424796 RepID=A0A7W6JEW5_9CAUL|nr:alkaline phosphatase D family protein [Brevundimonas lenta]MBB4083844.1 alkaline phosphatase D [Brevundimonas lenta]